MVTKKKSTSTKTPGRSSTTRKSTQKAAKYRTLKLASDTPFLHAKVSRQTFYWSILLLFIIVMQLIIIAMNFNASLVFDSLRLR